MMPTPDADAPRGMTVAALADELGDIDAVVEPLLLRRTQLRAEMTRLRLRTIAGERWRVDRAVTSPLAVDVAAIEACMGETWMTAFRKPQIRIGFAVAPRAPKVEEAP